VSLALPFQVHTYTHTQTHTTPQDEKTEKAELGGKNHVSGRKRILNNNVCLWEDRSSMHPGCLEKELS